MARRRRKLGEILIRNGVINANKLDKALAVAKGARKLIGETLVEMEFATENDIARALAEQFDMEFVDLDQPDAVNKETLSLIPPDVIKKNLVIPLGQANGRMKVLIHDPMDLDTLDNLRFRVNSEIDTALAPKSKIKDYIDGMFGERRDSIDEAVREMTMDLSMDVSIDAEAIELTGGAGVSDDSGSPVVRLVNQIIDRGVRGRASDIHIEPFEKRVRLRYRIDGVCVEQDSIPKRTQAAIIARLKIMSGMKVEEKRIPQDGRIKREIDGAQIDFRVSACPTYHGESVVLRILRPESVRIGLENLGLAPDTKEHFNRIIKRPNGIFLVTGPTGSGKTTTLYTALDVLNRPDRKIITAEDPVEYNLKGINQCQVNEPIGLTFSIILRAMLRQAPNIILVGEIRDQEVGDVAIQAALTGHLVFSTLHTNDAPSALTRLTDMGIKPFLVASSIQAAMAQRLVRILCEKCKQPHEGMDQKLMNLCGFRPEDLEGKTIYQANGCDECSGTGYRGRRAIFEMMVMNNELRELAFERAPLTRLRAAAENTGMRNLLGDGRLKILDGLTTPEEISRVAQVEGVVDVDE